MLRVLSIAILLCIGTGVVPATRAIDGSSPPPLLAEIQAELDAGLKDIDRAAEAAADAVRLATGGEDEVRQILGLVATHDPAVIDCGWVDPDGVLRWIEPADWRSHEGVDLSGEKLVRQLQRSRQPAMSEVGPSAEEIDASALAHPVITSSGRLAGAVRILFRPGPFVEHAVAGRLTGSGWDLWVVETGGRVLYASDASFVGRSLTGDDGLKSSPAFVELGRRLRTEPDGVIGTIDAGGASPAFQKGFWTTVTLDGAEWRVLLTRGASRL